MDTNLKLEVVRADQLDPDLQSKILVLCNKAFGEDMTPIFSTFKDAVHVLGYLESSLVSHALWVTRWLQSGTEPVMRTAYIEAVATEKEYRNLGFATAVMHRVAEEIREFDLGALSPSNAGYYERLGWELWRGPLFIRTSNGLIRSPSEEEVMILRLPRSPDLDSSAPLSAEWREGELW
jgi:aminoglycoside 2'-N-acetyltransferase I